VSSAILTLPFDKPHTTSYTEDHQRSDALQVKGQPYMDQLYGLGLTGLSVLLAALTSGFRLKPYLDAGVERTPMTFALYPAGIAVAIAVPTILLIRWWTGKKAITIGPVTFTGNLPFITLGCLLYVIIAVVFFPYQAPPPPLPKQPVQHAVFFPN
jgi:hypothetical protein